jgi:hypothetical protein
MRPVRATHGPVTAAGLRRYANCRPGTGTKMSMINRNRTRRYLWGCWVGRTRWVRDEKPGVGRQGAPSSVQPQDMRMGCPKT